MHAYVQYIYFMNYKINKIYIYIFTRSGKSSILAKISRAHPDIASYPFTTLVPNLGTIYFQDQTINVEDSGEGVPSHSNDAAHI